MPSGRVIAVCVFMNKTSVLRYSDLFFEMFKRHVRSADIVKHLGRKALEHALRRFHGKNGRLFYKPLLRSKTDSECRAEVIGGLPERVFGNPFFSSAAACGKFKKLRPEPYGNEDHLFHE